MPVQDWGHKAAGRAVAWITKNAKKIKTPTQRRKNVTGAGNAATLSPTSAASGFPKQQHLLYFAPVASAHLPFVSRFKGLKILLSAGFQTLAIQLLGVAFFYIVSLYLDKDAFGVLSWCNAVAITVNLLLSLGMEQVVIRRVAAGKARSDWAAAAYFLHTGISSLAVLLLLLLLSWLLPPNEKMQLLPWLFAAQSAVFVATPLKQLLNARERFAPYALIAVLANTAKIVLVFLVLRKGALSIGQVSGILLVCGLFELLAAWVYTRYFTGFRLRVRLMAYKKLVRESLPQFVFILFDSSLSRIDWILMGLMCADAVTAEYSFAYRAFEVARMPSLIQSMVLLPRAARLMQKDGMLPDGQNRKLGHLFTLVMGAALALIAVLNLAWTPLVDWVTGGKYGAVNALTFLLLSLCIPVHLATNIYWCFAFSARKYVQISRISIVCALVNLSANFVLIPLFAGQGAAMAFVLATLVQGILFYRLSARVGVQVNPWPALGMLLLAVALFAAAGFLSLGWGLKVLLWLPAFAGLALLLRLIRPGMLRSLKQSLLS